MDSPVPLAFPGSPVNERRRDRLRGFGGAVLGLLALAVGPFPRAAAQTFSEFPVPGGAPAVITAGPDGRLWFTEPAAERIGRISIDGAVTEFPLPAGSRPFGIAAGPDGKLWFAQQPGRIGSITPAGVVASFQIPASGFTDIPVSIAAGPDGNLWATESTSRVDRITTGGTIIGFETYYSGTYGIAAGPDGNLWFTVSSDFDTESKVCRITPAGVTTVMAYGFGGPAGITAGPDGNVWFTERSGNRVSRITPTGVLTRFDIPSVAEPVGIVTGPDGNLWFTEYAANKIGRITTAGVISEYPIPTAGSGPTWIAVGPDGNLWFAEETVHGIGRLNLAAPTACVADATTLCLNAGRFRVRAEWTTRDGASGAARAVGLTADSGYFTFFGPANVEVVAKVLNGCGFNSHFWLFASGLTNVHVVLTVADTATGESRAYENPIDTAFQSIQDTSAFGCTVASAVALRPRPLRLPPREAPPSFVGRLLPRRVDG
ncbi:MAG: hypothetical protein ABI592_11355 [Acidobacteriota bacterium]